jgi:hypothetical protein
MEDTSLDAGRLARGRTYANTGRVDSITVSPGRLAAPVYGSRTTPYRTQVFVEQLTDVQWDRFLDQVAGRAGHIAALLDRDMPHDLVAAAEDAGVRLLPGVGDLDPECTCPDWGYPCKHAAALCYQAARLLDADPFVLLLLRGRGEGELLDELQRRNARAHAATAGPAPADGLPAAEAWGREPGALPADPPVPPPAARGALAVPPAPGVEPGRLDLLVADAAARARELLVAADPPPVLAAWPDLVRMAATHAGVLELIAPDPRDELRWAVRAWEDGGLAGLETLTVPWSPPRGEMARARAALAAGWDGDDLPALRVWRNRWTAVGRGVQLRAGRDGRWYPYRSEAGEWWPAGPPDRDPGAVLAALLRGGETGER